MSERAFKFALGLTVVQQILLALSTYFIARAGLLLADGNAEEVLVHVSMFFVSALLAYITSSLATILAARAANSIWKNYNGRTLDLAVGNMMYASEKNRKSISQWLGGEAATTISQACSFYLGILSTSLNVILTIVVFYIALGWGVTLVVSLSLSFSFLVIMLLRQRIQVAAGDIQSRKLRSLMQIELTWCLAMFGNNSMRESGFECLNGKTEEYFREVNKYVLLEQVVACAPIIIATLSLVALIQIPDIFTASMVGALVAVLPRSLQVFGSVHALSIYFSQFFLVNSKLKNLCSFTSTLDKHANLYQAPLQGISIIDPAGASISALDLMNALEAGHIKVGRFCIHGGNGVGKSSFLKSLKSLVDDSILMTPETTFIDFDEPLSTGQVRMREINGVISASPAILMLDEWDANLDNANFESIDRLLTNAAQSIVVLEVRHVRAPNSHSIGNA
ncbi:hypothetical protein PpSQ1_02085 [Pseudomonas putida]|nr:hypothetical protein PpSQ1_02085 [Pseudomonas putida]